MGIMSKICIPISIGALASHEVVPFADVHTQVESTALNLASREIEGVEANLRFHRMICYFLFTSKHHICWKMENRHVGFQAHSRSEINGILALIFSSVSIGALACHEVVPFADVHTQVESTALNVASWEIEGVASNLRFHRMICYFLLTSRHHFCWKMEN